MPEHSHQPSDNPDSCTSISIGLQSRVLTRADFEAIPEFSTQSMTIPQIPETIARSPADPGTFNSNCIGIASLYRIAGWLKALHKIVWIAGPFLNSTAIRNHFAECSAGIVDCTIFLQSWHNAAGFWVNSQIWRNLLQSWGLQKGCAIPEHSRESLDNPPTFVSSIQVRKFHRQSINSGNHSQDCTSSTAQFKTVGCQSLPQLTQSILILSWLQF